MLFRLLASKLLETLACQCHANVLFPRILQYPSSSQYITRFALARDLLPLKTIRVTC